MKKVTESLNEHYGIVNATVRKVEGYGRSVNYRVDTAQGEKIVYKHSQTESGLCELLDAENHVHLRALLCLIIAVEIGHSFNVIL